MDMRNLNIMKLGLLLAICCGFVIYVTLCQSLKTCGTDEYYVKRRNGKIKCVPCPECVGGGIGYNISFVREEDVYGYKTCYPCEQCSPGTYRTLNSYTSYCYKCMLDCARTRRYASVSCGGDTEGHCGDCMTGNCISNLSIGHNEKLSVAPGILKKVKISDPEVVISTRKPADTNTDYDHADRRIHGDQTPPNKDVVKPDKEDRLNIKVLVISAGVTFGTCILIGIAILYCCNLFPCQNPSTTANGSAIHSKVHLLGNSVTSAINDHDVGTSEKSGQLSEKPISVSILMDEDEGLEVGRPLLEGDNLTDKNLEVDSPEVIPADTLNTLHTDVIVFEPETSDVRGELQSHGEDDSVTEGIGLQPVLNENIPITQVGIQPVQEGHVTQQTTINSRTYRYYNRPLQVDDETLTLAASRIHGEKRHELFITYMQLNKAKISAYDEKWIRDSHNYAFDAYMLDCLKHWLRKYAHEANLKWLLESLKKADFEDIAYDIVLLPENQAPENYPENDENLMCIDLVH